MSFNSPDKAQKDNTRLNTTASVTARTKKHAVRSRGSQQPPLLTLLDFDNTIRADRPEASRIVGIDEVGRGSLIGPVVAAAVYLPHPLPASLQTRLLCLNDSKTLPPKKREALAAILHQEACVGIGEASLEEVNHYNVFHASMLAFSRAYQGLTGCLDSDILLIDGKFCSSRLPASQQIPVIKGDQRSAAIAAASIVAKVHRDNWVIQQAKHYPGYGWETNMGYGTAAHLEGISRLGITPLHRQGFKRVQERAVQQSLLAEC